MYMYIPYGTLHEVHVYTYMNTSTVHVSLAGRTCLTFMSSISLRVRGRRPYMAESGGISEATAEPLEAVAAVRE